MDIEHRDFSDKLQAMIGKKLQLRLNNNQSTMLHVWWEKERTKVSLHRMFVEAPHEVHHALASYLRREDKVLSPTVKAYIQANKPKRLRETGVLFPQGVFFDLQAIYEALNRQYFNGDLKLSITWYGSEKRRYRSRCNLGLYVDAQKLVKIHRMLDHPHVPQFVIEYIVYHEMAHNVVPVYVDKDGINRIHSVEFKRIEQLFLHYRQAKEWLKLNRRNFFLPHKDRFRWPDTVNGQTSSIKKPKPMRKKAKSLRGFLKKLLTL